MKRLLFLLLLCAALAGSAEPDFTIAVFPDTQNMVAGYSAMWQAMPDWVIANADALNIQAVVSEGDITNADGLAEWAEAKTGWDKLLAAGLVVVPNTGNHDVSDLHPRVNANFDATFGAAYFAGKTWYKSQYASSNRNYWVQFAVGARKVGVIALEFFPSDAAVAWADAVIAANADTEFIITTHAYLYTTGQRTVTGDTWGIDYYGLTADNDGAELWDALIKKYSNITTVVGGHFIGPPLMSWMGAVGTNGNPVSQIFCNYQESNHGNGQIMLLTFQPSKRRVRVSSYSTVTSAYDANFPAFDLPYLVRPSTLTDGYVSIQGAVTIQ